MTTVKMPKRFEEQTIEKLLGAKTLQRLRVAYLREEALRITPITIEDVRLAKKCVEERKGQKSSSAFRRVAYKWVMENKFAHRNFLRYVADLSSIHEKESKNAKDKKRV
jgi:hypothetical protein